MSFLFMSKLFLDFQSKYHFQSDLSYDLKQKRYAQQPPAYTGGRHASVTPSPVLEQDQRSWILVAHTLMKIG